MPKVKIDGRKGRSGRKAGAVSHAYITLDVLSKSLYPHMKVPVSRVWLESLGLTEHSTNVGAVQIAQSIDKISPSGEDVAEKETAHVQVNVVDLTVDE